jgi:hypothetical protein
MVREQWRKFGGGVMEAASARSTQSGARRSKPSRAEFDAYSDDVLMNEREAAEVCGFSPLTLKHWRLTRRGKGPAAVRVYGSVRYRAGTIRQWLRATAAEGEA